MRALTLISSVALLGLHIVTVNFALAGAEGDQAAFQCDMLAAATDDTTKPDGIVGKEIAAIDSFAAVGACEKALSLGLQDVRLAFNLGRAYHAAGQKEKAFAQYRLAAEAGNASAMNHLGFAYDKGLGIAPDAVEASKWYLKSAEAGVARAQRNIGLSYKEAFGVEKDFAKSMQWFKKSADQGYAPAMVHVGILHEDGWGVPKNPVEALKWYEKAAALGDLDGMFDAGLLLSDGAKVPKDESRAVVLFEQASKQGHSAATASLGWAYELGIGGLPKDIKKANELYKQAAAAGDGDGMNSLAENLIAGEGIAKDVDLGVSMMIEALNAGSELAAYNLGAMRAKGENLPADPAKAADLFVVALEGLSTSVTEDFVTKKGEGYSAEVLNALQDALIKRGGTFAKVDGKLGDGAIAYMQSILAGN